MTRAAAISASPAVQVTRAPARATSEGASREAGSIAPAMGSMLTAETSPESPWMSCRYCKTMKMKPNRAKNCTKIDRLPAARAGRAKTRGVEHRDAAAELPSGEAGQDRQACGQAGQGAGGQPPLAGRLDDRVHQRDQAGHGQHGAADVKARGIGVG